MAKEPPKRPEKGQPIAHDWFGNFYDYVRSLEVRGDLATTQVSRDRTGTIVRAPFAAPWNERSGGGGDYRPIIAKISVDHNDGTYTATEQQIDTTVVGDIEAMSLEPITFDSGNSGYLYEINSRSGVPIDTVVVVHRLNDTNSGDVIWYFDATSDQYGFGGSITQAGATNKGRGGDGTVGAWVEITGESSGSYSWKQKDPDGSTDASPAISGSLNLKEVNGRREIPSGTIVWAWFDGTQYRFEYHYGYGFGGSPGSELAGQIGAWVELTDDTSPYSWKQKDPDASTDASPSVTGSNNLTEVSGRDGIPIGSIMWAWFDGSGYKCEYHGADAGTREVMLAGTTTSARTDVWDRSDQSTDRGVDQQFVSRLVFDASSDELLMFTRDKYHDANGHLTNYSTETKKVLGNIAQSTNTTPYKNCDTDAVVARFDNADIPASDWAWVYDGSQYVKSYRDSASSGAATSPVPCVVFTGTPTGCGSLDVSDFDDDFSDNSYDTCRNTKVELNSGTVTEQNGVLEHRFNGNANPNNAHSDSNAAVSGDFTVSIDFQNLSGAYYDGGLASSSSYYIYYLQVVINSVLYRVIVGEISFLVGDIGNGTYYYDTSGGWVLYDSTVPSSGTLSATRSGTSLTVKRGATTIKTWTGVSTNDPTEISINFEGRQRAGDGTATCDSTDISFT